MARVVVALDRISFTVDTAHLRVANDEEFGEALRQLPEVQKRVWDSFLDSYDIISAEYDTPEPDEDQLGGRINR